MSDLLSWHSAPLREQIAAQRAMPDTPNINVAVPWMSDKANPQRPAGLNTTMAL